MARFVSAAEAATIINDYAKENGLNYKASVATHSKGGAWVESVAVDVGKKNLAPVFHSTADHFDVDYILDSIAELASQIDGQNAEIEPIIKAFTDGTFKDVKERISLRLRPMIEDGTFTIPFVEGSGMELLFSFIVRENADGIESFKIPVEAVERWMNDGTTIKDIIEAGICHIRNERKVNNLGKVLAEMFGDEDIPEDMEIPEVPLTIATNNNNYFGASQIVDDRFLDEMGDKFEDDYYVIPSSIHEVLLLPTSQASGAEELSDMIRSINRDHVTPQERLSDVALIYRRADKKLSVA